MNKFLLMFLTLLISCQNNNHLKVMFAVPNELKEVSGLALNEDSNTLWMVNDSGNKPILYHINQNGKIINRVKINAKNKDWEDLTTDKKGNIYIGDFGNNANKRKHLVVYKINTKNIPQNNAAITPEIIKFRYPEQKKFPPKKNKRHFDAEAFFFFNDSLYLFTKSRAPKHIGRTNFYKIPAKTGTHNAKLINSFNSCNTPGCWITSAAITNDGTKIALLNENGFYLFKNIKTPSNFLKNTPTYYPFKIKSQKESIVFKTNNLVLIADEKKGYKGGNLYTYNFK